MRFHLERLALFVTILVLVVMVISFPLSDS